MWMNRSQRRLWERIGIALDEQVNDPSKCDMWKKDLPKPPEYIPSDVVDYFMKVGYPVETLFRECAFATRSFNCSSHIEEVFDRDYGKCFLMKNTKFLQTLPGIGLSLALNLDTRHAYAAMPPLFDGLVVKIEKRFDLAGHRKILLHPAKYTVVNLNAKKYNLIERAGLSHGSQLCKFDGEQHFKVLNSSYTLGACRMDCIQSMVLSVCKCVLPMSKRYIRKQVFINSDVNQTDSFCNFTATRKCAYPMILQARDNVEFQKCYSGCKVPCQYWEYNTEISFARFPSDMFLNPPGLNTRNNQTGSKNSRRKRQITSNTTTKTGFIPTTQQEYEQYDDYVDYSETEEEQQELEEARLKALEVECTKDSFSTQDWLDYIIVDIAFSSLQYTEITQEDSITFSRFVSDIGGQVGLWLGASMVSMIKIVMLAGPFVWFGLRERSIKKMGVEINKHLVHTRMKAMNTNG